MRPLLPLMQKQLWMKQISITILLLQNSTVKMLKIHPYLELLSCMNKLKYNHWKINFQKVRNAHQVIGGFVIYTKVNFQTVHYIWNCLQIQEKQFLDNIMVVWSVPILIISLHFANLIEAARIVKADLIMKQFAMLPTKN